MRRFHLQVCLHAVLTVAVGSALAGDAPLVATAATIDPLDAAAGDGFGSSIAVAGDGVLVGCRGADTPTTNAGAVHYFRDLGDGLVQVQKITPSDPDLRFEYGHAIGGAGDLAAIGVPMSPGGGRVSVLTRSGGSWRQAARLQSVAKNAGDGDAFGDSVAVRADGTIAVGVPGAVVGGEVAAGAVEIFSVDGGGGWTWTDTVTADEPVGNDRFGASVAFLGDELIVGMPFDDERGLNAGAVVRHRKLPVLGWFPVQTITPPDGESEGYFGRRVATDGDRLVVGAPRLDVAGTDAGAVIVYRLDGGQLVEEATILPDTPRAFDDFGDAVAIAGDRVVVGAPADPTAATFMGSVAVYELLAGQPRPVMRLVPFGSGYAFFGTAVGSFGPWVLGGAPLASETGQFAGAVYAVDAATDCDDSGVPDVVELWTEPDADADGNGTLDRCECPEDLVADGIVNGADLGQYLIYATGPCGPGTFNPDCIGDFNGDGEIRGGDLGILLIAWGPCF